MRSYNLINNFWQRISWFSHRWRTQRNAIGNVNCRMWIIEFLNAPCALLDLHPESMPVWGPRISSNDNFFLRKKVGGSVLRVLPFALAPSKYISWTVIARDRQIYIPLPLGFDNYQKTEVMDTLLFHGVQCWLLKTAHGLVVASALSGKGFFNSNGLRSGRTTRWT